MTAPIVTIAGVAEILEVSRSAAWRVATRHPDFPHPLPGASRVNIWRRDEVVTFAALRRREHLQTAQLAARHLLKVLSWVRPLSEDAPALVHARAAYEALTEELHIS